MVSKVEVEAVALSAAVAAGPDSVILEIEAVGRFLEWIKMGGLLSHRDVVCWCVPPVVLK